MEKDKYLNISRPNKNCLLCGGSLVEIQKHPSILVDSQEEMALRKDFCHKCWDQINNKDYFSYWITRRIAPDPKRKFSKKERDALLLRLFESLYQKTDEKSIYILFYLAHLLMRYKVFAWKGSRITPEDSETQTPEKTTLIFENKLTGEEIQIPDQDLDGEKIAESKKEIDGYLATNIPELSSEESLVEETPYQNSTNNDQSSL
jgi:hypothetical protein